MLNGFLEEIINLQNPESAEGCKRFFKTQKGEYAYGDMFLGVSAPILRKIAKKYYSALSLQDISIALKNRYHEVRACSLMVLVLQYQRSKDCEKQRQIYELYLSGADFINNWDLVDISAANIVGDYLYNHNQANAQKVLFCLATKNNLWSQRIAIVATHYFIKQEQYDLTLRLAEKFLNHKHDLMHKAVGWMLREVGKRDKTVLIKFLDNNAQLMPRTMLRYAIEKFDKKERTRYLLERNNSLS